MDVNSTYHVVSQVSFSWYDYVLFSAMLAVSALIGVYFGCFGSKQSSADEYLMGNKKMKVIPIAVSLVACHISGFTLLAVPADIYRYGAAYFNSFFAYCLVTILTIFIYLPVFYKLQLTSTYEYLERRFDTRSRLLASFLFTLGLLLYLPIVIYIPALALSAATKISIHFITPVVCGVCIFYTTLGGLKAVVWTDTLQFAITAGAVFTVMFVGIKAEHGLTEIWLKALQGDRLDVFNFNPDLTQRDSFWLCLAGLSTSWLQTVAVHQSSVQKYLSVSSLKEAKLVLIYKTIGMVVITTVSISLGLIMYARYSTCDPFTVGVVQKNDQLVPYYIMDAASHIPGLSGLFIAGVFCAGLSTLSACLNCLAGTLFEDFITKITGPISDDKKATLILKMIVVGAGIICTLLVFVVEKLGSLLALAVSFDAVTTGPLLGMFTLGVLFPRASCKGVYYGAISGLLFSGFLVFMNQYYKSQGLIPDLLKPTSVEGCFQEQIANFTEIYNSTGSFTTTNSDYEIWKLQEDKPFVLFRISHYCFAPIGLTTTIIVGFLISYFCKNEDPPVHRALLSPIIYSLLPNDKVEEKQYYDLKTAVDLVTVNSEDSKLEFEYNCNRKSLVEI